MTAAAPLRVGQIISGPHFNEPMRVETLRLNAPDTWVVGLVGLWSERFRSVTLTRRERETLTIQDTTVTYEGDARLLRLGLQAYSLGLAYEFDPYFGLSISRVDPLPHQLEAVYDYLLKLPCVRFLLADDAGAGKTIMAGLLIRELKLRGLAERFLIVCPANLTFQWQRELKEKFDEKFLTLKGSHIRDEEIEELKHFAARAKAVEDSGAEAKLSRLKELLQERGFFDHPDQRLLIFVDHYWLEVDAMTRPMQVREDASLYGGDQP